ncbi:Arm DNA-binding domain-containing protein [Pseudomonas aeruginosa]|uniref:Arm DNA-binding domain-containing protein n=1 Tax=Pseudomonas aeruginosa TaxID=287 RepID=UPI002B278620|nr:Arm DNA-binding domain-containing protein [Pseudomonas aeruginosa]
MSATLDDSGFSALQPKDHPYKVGAGASLFLKVNPHGSKLWRLKYLVRGTEKGLALGTYPTM